ncbi:MAG TPA: DoxX family protein [Bacteroidia bacterium]|nr:DoxX family protein [Bacteroidia bacterium]
MLVSVHFSQIVAVFLARVFLGLLFFYQGYDKIFRIKVKNVIQTIYMPLVNKGVPKFLSVLGAYATSYIELICGAALIIGFMKNWSLYLLSFDVLFAAIVFGLVEPMWDTRHIFPRIVLLVFLLLIPTQWDVISMDNFLPIIKYIHINF